jgi:hypothetical protein
MGLILRQTTTPNSGNTISVKGSTLTYAETDGNFAYLLTSMSGSSISITGTTKVTGSLYASLGITGSLSGSLTGLLVGTSSWATNALTASSADNFTARGTITAQTLLVQTITSSVEWVTGSSKFGSISTNTHQFTGSVSVSGSLTSTSLTTGIITALSASTIKQDGDSSGTTGTLNVLSDRNTYSSAPGYDASIYIGAKRQDIVANDKISGFRLFVSNSAGANHSILSIQGATGSTASSTLPSNYYSIVDITSGGATINDILTLSLRTTTPASPSTGSIICSGSGANNHLYYYNGTAWKQLDN